MPKPEVFVANSDQKFDDSGELTDEPTRKVLLTWIGAYKDWIEKNVSKNVLFWMTATRLRSAAATSI